MRYLNPKADLTFKKVFGEHPDLVISFLNALLPFDGEDEEISEVVEYLNPELVPFNPLHKDSIVDVRCKDKRGRQFLVEMQMMWTSAYKQRVLFNASKAYVSQLHVGDYYDALQPVYSLNLVNDTFSDSERYYHDYRIVEVEETREVIEGLRFIFIELPKFTPKNYGDKKMQVLWLRYLTEIDERTEKVSSDLMDNPEISKAVNQLEESAFTEAQMLGYEKFWDVIRTEHLNITGSRRDGFIKGHAEGYAKGIDEGRAEGIAEGRAEGRAEGIAEGEQRGEFKERCKNARAMRAAGIPVDTISKILGLTAEEVMAL